MGRGGGGLPVITSVSEHASYPPCPFFWFKVISGVPVILLNHTIKSAAVY